MTEVPRTQAEAFNALLRMHFGSFLHKAVEDLNPGSPFQSNWHICAIEHALEQMMAGNSKRLIVKADLLLTDPPYNVAIDRNVCGKGTARLVEYDPHYCDVIIQRFEKLAGKEAILAPQNDDAML